MAGKITLTDISASKLESKLLSQRGASVLNLSDSFIGDEGCALIAGFIKENLSLHSIELKGNGISGEGLKYLSTAFRGQSFVRTLSLEWNNIGDSIGILLETLGICESLQSIDLRNNRIGPEGAASISRFIENSQSIKKIDLRWNDLGSLGGKKILNSLSKNRSLRSIELSGNRIPEDLIQQIDQAIKGSQEKTKETLSDFHLEYRQERSPLKFSVLGEDSKYESQMITNARNEARVKELEILLEQETRKGQDLRNDLSKELEAERMRRLISEESFSRFKEESLSREMELERSLGEIEGEFGYLIKDKQATDAELQRVRAEYQNYFENSQGEIKDLEGKLANQEKQNRALEESARSALDRARVETDKTMFELSRDYQNRLEKSEESLRSVRSFKESLETEVKNLKSQIVQIKSQSQESLSSLENRLKEEEEIKYNLAAKNFESRIKTLEDSREGLNKLLLDTQKEFSQYEKRSIDQISNFEISLNLVKEEKSDLLIKLQHLTSQKEALISDFMVTKSALDRAERENQDLNKTLKERKEEFLAQINRICQENTLEKKEIAGKTDQLVSQVRDLEAELNKIKKEKERVLKEHEYLAEILKQRANSLIQDTVLSHMRKLEND